MELFVSLIWGGVGAIAGLLHSRMLWRGLAAPLFALARMGLVAGCLVGAAFAGGLLPAAAGWFAAFLFAGLLRWKRAES
jgi:hypothetical protein